MNHDGRWSTGRRRASDRAAAAVLLGLVLGGCAIPSRPPPERTDTASSDIVYGNDDRKEYYEVDDARLRALAAQRMVAVLPVTSLAPSPGGYDVRAPALGDVENLCRGQPFAEQPAAAACSALLVDEQTILTAGHCAERLSCEGVRFVFGFMYTSAGVLPPIRDDDVYRCDEVISIEHSPAESDNKVDYAWIRLDRPVATCPPPLGRRDRSTPLQADEPLTLMGFAGGVPLKVAGGGMVVDPRRDALDYFVSDLDAFGGESGGPVFDAAANLVGIEARGGPDLLAVDPGCNVVFTEPDVPAAAEEQATYAFRAFEGLCRDAPGHRLCAPGAAPCVIPVRFFVTGGCSLTAAPGEAGTESRRAAGVAVVAFGLLVSRRARRAPV